VPLLQIDEVNFSIGFWPFVAISLQDMPEVSRGIAALLAVDPTRAVPDFYFGSRNTIEGIDRTRQLVRRLDAHGDQGQRLCK